MPSKGYSSLKFWLSEVVELPDYTEYRSEFVLDDHLERKQNEIEICRFQLKEGAVLRTNYKDFYDIQTEYDTVNLADATWSSAGSNTLSRDVTDYFAEKVLECGCAGNKAGREDDRLRIGQTETGMLHRIMLVFINEIKYNFS